MKTKKIEVLAPAGNPAALKAAVFAGADAVYMGGSLFSARASAVNFSREEMREAVLFARERNVRVYVTVNTLLKDDELPEALDFCKFLCSVPVDGILIQDMGLFNILREACPEMPLHASTQMSLHTPGGAALLKELGASRVVLAREMSLKEIEEVSKKTDVELEAFVHGALCIAFRPVLFQRHARRPQRQPWALCSNLPSAVCRARWHGARPQFKGHVVHRPHRNAA